MILRKIIKIVATRCQILRLKCTKFDFGWGSAPDPAGGAYSAPPDPLAGFGPYFQGEGRRGEGRERQQGRGGEEREGKGLSLPKVNFLVTSLGRGGRGGKGRDGRERGKRGKGREGGSLRHCRWGGRRPWVFFINFVPP